MGIVESFEDYRSLSKLTFGLFYGFFLVQMLLFYWKVSIKMDGDMVHQWGGLLKALAKAAHYEILPSITMILFAIFTFSYNLAAVLFFLVTIVGDTLIVIGYHRGREGENMLLLGRLATHFSTVVVLLIALFNTCAFGSPEIN